jgi:hypothetical protein
MSRKPKQPEVVRCYFDDVRNYAQVAEAEAVFFRSLLAKKSELRANHTLYSALDQAVQFLTDPQGRKLEILVEFDVDDHHRNKRQKMHLGTLLSPGAEPQITHFLCLSEDTDFLAKIHLDRDFSVNDKGGKPNPHIQVGGRVSASLATKVTGKAFWRDDLDKPRIPSLPVCSPLLWHWAFLEYRDDQNIAPFLDAAWWPGMVQAAEQAVLKPFFEDGLKVMTEKPAKGLLNAFYKPLAR